MRFQNDKLLVSTIAVPDGRLPFETYVSHHDYDESVVVEAYKTEAKARTGHDKWVELMTSKELPMELKDCSNSIFAQLLTKPMIAKRRNNVSKEEAH